MEKGCQCFDNVISIFVIKQTAGMTHSQASSMILLIFLSLSFVTRPIFPSHFIDFVWFPLDLIVSSSSFSFTSSCLRQLCKQIRVAK